MVYMISWLLEKKKKIPHKKLTNWSWKNETLAVNVVLIWGIYIYMDLVSLLGIMIHDDPIS